MKTQAPIKLRRLLSLPALAIAMLATPIVSSAQTSTAPWDSVGRILKAPVSLTGGYYRYNFPRRDITLKMGDVTVSPSLALGSWAGFDGDPANATMMGDLALLTGELKGVLAEMARQGIAVNAIHNHLVGEVPEIIQVHYHAHGNALDLAARLNIVISRSATPRPVTAAPPAPLAVDTALVFGTLGIRGRAQGNVVQVSTDIVQRDVKIHGVVQNPSLAYTTPISIQMVSADRAVATGDFSIRAGRVDAVTQVLAKNGITATAVHSHLVDEEPAIRYIHFWADGALRDVLRGLRAALDAGRSE